LQPFEVDTAEIIFLHELCTLSNRSEISQNMTHAWKAKGTTCTMHFWEVTFLSWVRGLWQGVS
jgi:hypothetical protein